MIKIKILHSIRQMFIKQPQKGSTNRQILQVSDAIQLILDLFSAKYVCIRSYLSLVVFFNFLYMIPQITLAQQTKELTNGEKKSVRVFKSAEEEEEEGTLEAEMEHQRSVWYKGMQKKNANYIKVKKQYDNYFKKYPNENSKPRQLYAGWLKTNIFYLDKKGRVQAPPAVNYNSIQKLATVPWATVTDTMAGDWRMVGPRNTYFAGYSGVGNNGGYVNCVRIDPTNPNKLFVGFQQGGLWVSNDGGLVWQLTDKNFPDRAYMDIDVCRANSNIVYAISHADGNNKNGAVLKSTDGGLTWLPTFLNSTNYPGVKAYDIAVSPTDPNVVLARWGTNLYRTTDGGGSWTSILAGLKDYSPSNGSGSKSEVLDFHQANDAVVYHLDRNDSQNYVTLYRSDNAGASFTNLGNISIPAGSLGTTSINSAKLLSASNNPNALYIAMGTAGTASTIHLLKLDPITGAILLSRVNMINESLSSGDIAMDINNDQIIVNGAYGPNKSNYSTDNGATFTVSTTAVHADLRSLCIVNGKVLLGTDGEAVYSTDGGITYKNLTKTISNHEIWGFGASHKTGILGVGLNHGPLAIREHEGSGGWYNAMGADQQNTDVNPLDDKYLYSRGYDTYHVVRTGPHTMTSGAGQQEIDPGREDCFNNMTFHPNLYYTLITHHGGVKPANNPNLALWKKSLIRSDDNGVTINKIIKTFNTDVRREAICMTDPNRIYVMEGLVDNKLWKTTDGGDNWIEITPSAAVTGTAVRNISDIVVSDANANEIWVTYSGVQNTCKVLHSTDGGLTFTNLTTAALTTWPITRMIFQRGSNGGVYVGNRAGVFYRNNSMSEWALIGNGLPMVDVRFMFINYFKGKLMIGTNRGVWDHDLYELTAPKAQISASTNKIVTCGSSVNFADYSVLHNDAQTSYSWSFPGGSPSTSTLEKPIVSYSTPGNYDVSLTVTDQYGSSTQTLSNFITVDCTASIETGSVTSIADAYVRDGGSAGNNYGTQNALMVKKDGLGYTRETYLKFDLSTLPSTADKISLQLNVASANTNVGAANWQVYYVPTDSWTETGLIWNNKPDPSTLLATVRGKSSGTVTWDITSQALLELGGDKILSLKIVSAVAGGTTDATFSSKEDPNASLRPQIKTSIINKVPMVSITSPANNAVIPAGSNLTINANASDADGTVSKVEFYQGNTLLGESTTAPYSFTWNNPAAGSYVLTAKVTDNNGTTSPSLDVNVTVNTVSTVAITSPANNSVFAAGSNITINANANDADGTITKVEFYQDSTLLGESTIAPYSFIWNNPAEGTYALTAKATDNNNGVTTSSAVNIKVNAAPTVAITSPVNNAVFAAGSNVMINANATDTDGTISKVEFYQGSTLLGQSTTAPYSFTWNNPAVGTYVLTAKATDSNNGVTTSSSVNIIVNSVPTVSITSPANNTVFAAGSNVTINANATDADGSITKVEFYQGSTLLGQSTTAPYSFTWNNPAVGTYVLTAKATDNNNEVATSSAVNISVNTAPTVAITSPVNNAVFAAGSNVTINANATDSDGTISKVEFYQGSTLLGQSTTVPYSFTWNNLAAGTYVLTAKATDNLGGVTTSSPVSITVTQSLLTTTPVADAFVRNGTYVRTNYGTETTLEVKNDGSSYFRQSYLRFNYSAFTGSAASNVKLRVYASIVNADPSRVVSVYGIANTNWGENKINWNNQPSETGTLLGSYTITDVSGVWYELDVTSYINNQLALGNKIVSFRLVNQGVLSTTGNVSFNSREASTNKPQLVLAYGSPSGRIKTDVGEKTGVVDSTALNVIVSPNPSAYEFKVQVESSSDEAVQIRVYNANQQLIKQLKTVVGKIVTFGNDIPAGVYLVEVRQGSERKTVKVVKF